MTAPITWAESTTPITWSTIGINWNSPAKANSSAFGVTSGYSQINSATLSSSVSFTNNMGKVHASTLATSGVISFGVQNGYTSAGGFTFDSQASFALTQDYVTYVNNTNYADSITIGSTVGVSSSNLFLWSDASDPTTVWTKVEYPN